QRCVPIAGLEITAEPTTLSVRTTKLATIATAVACGDPPRKHLAARRNLDPNNYTVWVPPNVKTLRGVIVHQHGCGEGSCKWGLTGAYDLHWQAPPRKHDCALLSPSYEQPEKADCQMWCDPRNGSDAAFQKFAAFQKGVAKLIEQCQKAGAKQIFLVT